MPHRKSKKKRKADGRLRPRNPYVMEAKTRGGGGFHGKGGHPAKEESRTCCRSRIDPNDYEDWREELKEDS